MENAPFAIILAPTRELVLQIEVSGGEEDTVGSNVFCAGYVERLQRVEHPHAKSSWHQYRQGI